MAYADSIRVSRPTFEDTATLIDGVADSLDKTADNAQSVRVGTVSGPWTTTSYLLITSMSLSVTVAAGDKIDFTFDSSLSSSGTNSVWNLSLHEGGTIVSAGAFSVDDSSYNTGTTGTRLHVCKRSIFTPSTTGAVTFDMRVQRASGTGGLYFINHTLTVSVIPASL